MEKLPSNPVLEFNPNQLHEVRILNGYEDAKQMSQAIDALDDWIKKQNHFAFKDFDREYLERLIINNKGSIERVKQRLDRTCTLRNLVPELMCHIDISNEFQNLRKILHLCIFPKPTKDNCRVVYESFIKPDDSYNVQQAFRYTYWVLQYFLFNDYSAGVECIIDLREYSFSMLSTLSFTDMHKGITMLMQTYGSRCKSLHFIISNKVIDGVITLLRRCLSDKLNKRIHVHNSYETICEAVDKSVLPVEIGGEYKKTVNEISDEFYKDLCTESNQARINHLDAAQFIKPKLLERLMVHETLEELHKVLPTIYLPKDYGGEDYSMEEFKDLYQKEFRRGKTLEYLLDGCKKVSDEKKRPGVNRNEELAGTFKKLNID